MADKNIRVKYSKEFDLQRQVVSHITSLSWQNIPHITYLYEPDISDFYNEFNKLKQLKEKSGKKVSINTILLKVIIEGLKADPELNALLDYNQRKARGKVYVCEDINLTVPWKLADGRMITPTLLNTGSLSLDELADAVSLLGKKIANTNIDELLHQAAIQDTLNEVKKVNLGMVPRILANFSRLKGLSGKAKKAYYGISKEERLTDSDLTSGTVTVSNIGSLYKAQRGFFGLIEIIPHQIFAIGLGAIQEKPGVFTNKNNEKEVGIRNILPMCLVFDHRAVDFDAVIPFIKKLDEIFAQPEVIRNW